MIKILNKFDDTNAIINNNVEIIFHYQNQNKKLDYQNLKTYLYFQILKDLKEQ